MKPILLSLLALTLTAAELPKVTFSRAFPGSTPAYFAISVDKEGAAQYKEATDDQNPMVFKLTPEEAGHIFALAEKLGRFTRPIESGLKVAKTGVKIFRYENGAEKNQVEFNYSLDLDAQKLLDIFENIGETERDYINLESAAKFDKLGVNQALLALESSLDQKRLVAPQQFLPLLDRVAKNESYMHMARARAAKLAEAIRNPQPVSQ